MPRALRSYAATPESGSRQLPGFPPDPNYICDFLSSLNHGQRHEIAASFKFGPVKLKPDDALYAHAAVKLNPHCTD